MLLSVRRCRTGVGSEPGCPVRSRVDCGSALTRARVDLTVCACACVQPQPRAICWASSMARWRLARCGDHAAACARPRPVASRCLLLTRVHAAAATGGQELLEETMSKHDPAGTTLCIHSVVTAFSMRRRGVAQQMLTDYIAHIRAEAPSVTLIKLLTKPTNAPLCPCHPPHPPAAGDI